MKQGSITSFIKKKTLEQDISQNETEKLKSTIKSDIVNKNEQEIIKNSNDTPIKLHTLKEKISEKNEIQNEINTSINESRKKRKHIIDEDEEEVIKTELLAEDLLIPSKQSKIEKGKIKFFISLNQNYPPKIQTIILLTEITL
jgi:hypothetical protein